MIPLADIPRQFVGDPQTGLKEILRHIPGGKAHTRNTETTGAWVLEVTAGMTPLFEVTYQEPLYGTRTQRDYAAEKTRTISAWLTEVATKTALHAAYTGPAIVDPLVRVPPTVKQILSEAKVRPEVAPERSSREDALVAKLLANRRPA